MAQPLGPGLKQVEDEAGRQRRTVQPRGEPGRPRQGAGQAQQVEPGAGPKQPGDGAKGAPPR